MLCVTLLLVDYFILRYYTILIHFLVNDILMCKYAFLDREKNFILIREFSFTQFKDDILFFFLSYKN